jgi:nicotinamidase-related amidase
MLDPKTALVVIDLQKGILSFPMAHPSAPVLERAGRLAKAFRAKGQPVVLVNVAGGAPGRTDSGPMKFTPPPDWLEIVPELDARPSDTRVTKQQWGAFYGTALDLEPILIAMREWGDRYKRRLQELEPEAAPRRARA